MSSRAASLAERLNRPDLCVGLNSKTAWSGTTKATIAVPGLEGAFPYGVPAALHVMEAVRAPDAASVGAVVLALLQGLPTGGTVVWITQNLALGEAGAAYGPGFVEHGHDPGRFLFVTARRAMDALWAMEEALRSRAVCAVVAELSERKAIDLTSTRRLALRSERAALPAFVIAQAALGEAALAARSRWRIAPAPSRATSMHDTLMGDPTFDIAILKNRDGACPRLTLALDVSSGTFRRVPQHVHRSASPSPTNQPAQTGNRALIAPALIRLAAERRRQFEHARLRS